MATTSEMENGHSSESPTSKPNLSRTDIALLEKCILQLRASRKHFWNYAKECPGFNPQYVKELCTKLDEGIAYAEVLATSDLEDAHDITITPAAAARKSPVVLVIDTTPGLAMMIEHIVQVHNQSPTILDLFIDTEGDCLSGALSLTQIFVESINTVYLIDSLTLGEAIFTTSALMCGTSLKDIFESSTIRKAVYGVIGDSHEVWRNYGIHVAGIDDLHLMGIAAYGFKRKAGGRSLAQSVEINTKGEMTEAQREEWIARKGWGKKVFQETAEQHNRIIEGEESGGWVPVFNVRPLTQEVRDYAVADVTVLPILYRRFTTKIPQFEDADLWFERVAEKTKEHIIKSQSSAFDPNQKGVSTGVPEWEGLPYQKSSG